MPKISVSCTTWLRDTHGLLDSESTSISTNELAIQGPCRIVRNNMAVETRGMSAKFEEEVKSLVGVGFLGGKCWAYSPIAKVPDAAKEELWLILKNYNSENGEPGVKLQTNDIIKLGRCKFVVKELSSPHLLHTSSMNLNASMEFKAADCDRLPTQGPVNGSFTLVKKSGLKPDAILSDVTKEEDTRCRICLSCENQEENPLIASPCKCSGSIQFIHVYCLQQWLKSKVVEKITDEVVSYYWQSLECDVCKQKYPGIAG